MATPGRLLFATCLVAVSRRDGSALAMRAPDKAPDLPEGWCDKRYGTPTATTGECMCKHECEGRGCERAQGFIWYAYAKCPSCECVPAAGAAADLPPAEKPKPPSPPPKAAAGGDAGCGGDGGGCGDGAAAKGVAAGGDEGGEGDDDDDMGDGYVRYEGAHDPFNFEGDDAPPQSALEAALEWADEHARGFFAGLIVLAMLAVFLPALFMMSSQTGKPPAAAAAAVGGGKPSATASADAGGADADAAVAPAAAAGEGSKKSD